MLLVFPMYVGVIPPGISDHGYQTRIPHVRGGDPSRPVGS